MDRKKKFLSARLPGRVAALLLAAAMVVTSLYQGDVTVEAATTTTSWKFDVQGALEALAAAEEGADGYAEALAALQEAYDNLVLATCVENLTVVDVTEDTVTLQWDVLEDDTLVGYNVYWSDCDTETTNYVLLDADSNNCYDDETMTISVSDLDSSETTVTFTVQMSAYYKRYFKVAPVTTGGVGSKCEAVVAQNGLQYEVELEHLTRGLTVTQISDTQVYLSWRLLVTDGIDEDGDGYADETTDTGLVGYNFNVYRNGVLLATVTDSTNYIDDTFGGELTESTYIIVPVDADGVELTDEACASADIFTYDSSNSNVAYIDIPLQKPASTTIRETYGVDEIALGGYTMTDSGYTSADDVITYSANDMSVADVDGDGEYEYLVQWEPSLSKDVSQQGYTGTTILDCYELDGTLLWRLDLGINIRAGAHYTEFALYDFDYDGGAELIVKTAPGTQMTIYKLDENGQNVTDENGDLVVSESYYVTNTESAIEEYGDSDTLDTTSFVFSADDYREYLIDVFMDWGVWSRYSEETVANAIDGIWSDNLVTMFTTSYEWSDSTFYTGEVSGNANVTFTLTESTTVEQIQQYIPDYQEGDVLVNVALYDEDGNLQYVSSSSGSNPVMKTVKLEDVVNYYGNYDLASCNHDGGYTEEEATILADYFLTHYEYRMKKHSLETWEGYIVTGPEYVTLFDGDGSELDTVDWYYEREDDGLLWGDYAMNYIEPGNRNDRFNVAVAYLDGETASCIMGRGYYTRTTMVAYNVVNGKLVVVGAIDSGWTVMTNPFNDSPHGYDGCDPVNGTLSGQGDHYIAVADVDGDGCQDIINGGAIVSYKNGDLYLYSSGGDYLNGGTSDTWAKYGHGDAIHITDIDPDNPGLEIVSCFEGGTGAPYNWALRDARSNVALFGAPGTTDYGRIIIGDNLTDVSGLEISAGYDAKGNAVTLYGVGTNMNIKWDEDMSTQFVNNTSNITITGNVNNASYTYLTANGYVTNNSTKGNPSLVADLFGDYREEIILPKSDSSSLRIYMNVEESTHKDYTLMQNAQYRVGIASQNSSYNQPAYTDYYYASDTDWTRVTIPTLATLNATSDDDTVDKSELQTETEEDETIVESAYTAASYAVYAAALANAQTVLADPNATQAEVDAALAALQEAKAALVKADTSGGDSGDDD
ncbi:MAG: fibronectin type III domain-containing protein, partial [Lachnospiraceae bacterium]|nr:fibronectin type III domain-containing protein [Lachnospiraceae bacterium]